MNPNTKEDDKSPKHAYLGNIIIWSNAKGKRFRIFISFGLKNYLDDALCFLNEAEIVCYLVVETFYQIE